MARAARRGRRADFGELVEAAIDRLPEQYRRAVVEDVPIQVVPRPTPQQLESVGLEHDELLLGLYEGVPLPDRHVEAPAVTPDRIWLFREDIEDASRDDADLIEQVRVTLLHELGHHFGLDEDDLDGLGYG